MLNCAQRIFCLWQCSMLAWRPSHSKLPHIHMSSMYECEGHHRTTNQNSDLLAGLTGSIAPGGRSEYAL